MPELKTTTVDSTAAAPASPVASSRKSGLTFRRHFTKPGVSPYDELEWELRLAQITDAQGNVIFEQKDVEVPKDWSMTATNIVASKYLHGKIGTPERETGVRQLVARVAETIRDWGMAQGYFKTPEDGATFHDELVHILVRQYAAFNSPVWFNVGCDRIEPNSANFPFQPVVLFPHEHVESFVQQRMRLWATVNPTENVEGYIQVQIGGILWGQNVDFPKTFDGPKFPPNEDRVGIMLPNCPQYVIAAFAILRLGATVVNTNPLYTPREVLVVAKDSAMRALLTLDALAPAVCVIDSIQAVHDPDGPGSAGSVTQVRDGAQVVVRLAKERGVAVLVVGGEAHHEPVTHAGHLPLAREPAEPAARRRAEFTPARVRTPRAGPRRLEVYRLWRTEPREATT